jgi:hypothetical protein
MRAGERFRRNAEQVFRDFIVPGQRLGASGFRATELMSASIPRRRVPGRPFTIVIALRPSRPWLKRNVTFPARQYSVNGERRSFALLRPVADTAAQDRIGSIHDLYKNGLDKSV